MTDRTTDELERLWKRLKKCPPDWKDIYDTFQFARRAMEAEEAHFILIKALRSELTQRDAEVIRLNEIITLLENMCFNNDILLKKAVASFAKMKKENAELKVKAKELEIADIKMKVLLEELQKIDPLQYT